MVIFCNLKFNFGRFEMHHFSDINLFFLYVCDQRVEATTEASTRESG